MTRTAQIPECFDDPGSHQPQTALRPGDLCETPFDDPGWVTYAGLSEDGKPVFLDDEDHSVDVSGLVDVTWVEAAGEFPAFWEASVRYAGSD